MEAISRSGDGTFSVTDVTGEQGLFQRASGLAAIWAISRSFKSLAGL